MLCRGHADSARRVRCLTGLLLLTGAALLAQEPRTGREPETFGRLEVIVSTPDGHRLAGARAELSGPSLPGRRTYSDREGRLSFPVLPPGRYELRVELESFQPLTRAVEVAAGETAEVSLALTLVPLTETLTVAAVRSEQRLGDVPVQVWVLTRDGLAQSAALTLDDALKQVPSFSLFRRTSSLVAHPTAQGVSLRGVGASGTSRTLVLVDGIPHNDAFGNWVYWSKIPLSQLESVEVVEGGLSNLYGSSAMAGAIHLATRRPARRTLELTGQAGLRGTGLLEAYGSHAVGSLGLAAGGRVFRTGGYYLVAPEQRGAVDTRAASRHELFHWRADYAFRPGVTLVHRGRFFDEARDNGTLLQRNDTRELFLAGGLRARTADGSDWQVNLFSHRQSFSSSFSNIAADRASETLTLLQDVPSRDFGVTAHWLRRLGNAHTLSVGADTRWIGADNREDVFLATGVNIRDRRIAAEQLQAGAFFQDVLTVGARLVLVAGARVDYWQNFGASRTELFTLTGATTRVDFPDASTTTVTPRAGLVYHLREGLSLRAAFYQGFRAPTLNELYRPFRVGSVETLANELLGPERLTGGEAGFHWGLARRLWWSASGFWNRVRDTVSNVTLSATPTLIVRQRQNLGRVRVRGADSRLDYRVTLRWRLTAAYLLDDAIVRNFAAEPALVGRRLAQVPRHRATLTLGYFNPARVLLSLQGRWESARFDDDLNRIRLGGFGVVDLAVARPLGESWAVFLAVENLLDRRYAVQATPVELRGTPVIISGGVRFRLSGR